MKRKTYPTDLSDEQWKSLASMLPPPELLGRKRRVDLRRVFNALCYLTRAGCQWRMLPEEYPKWQTVDYYFRRWRDADCFVAVNDKLRQKMRSANSSSRARQSLIRNRSKLMDKPLQKAMTRAKRSKGASVIFWLARP